MGPNPIPDVHREEDDMEDRENAMEDKGCLSYQKPGDRPAMVPSLEHGPLTP